MAKRVVSLEIEVGVVRVMETTGRKVTKWASLSFEPTMTDRRVISDHQALSTTIRQVMTSSGIVGRGVVASVSGLYSVNRTLILPNQSGPVTRETVVEALKVAMPLPVDEMYLAWQTIASGEEGNHVLAVGVPRDVIDAGMRALKAAGVSPRLLDFKGMALARAVNRERALILNIEPSSLDIVIVANGVPEVMRALPWQREDFTPEDMVEHLALSLELTVGFYNSQHHGMPLEPDIPLFITGQMSADLTLVARLHARTGYPSVPFEPLLECPPHLPVSQYAVNIGLALRRAVPPEKNEAGSHIVGMNLLPHAYKPWRPTTRQIYLSCSVVAAIGLLFPLFNLTSGAMSKTAVLKARSDILNNKLKERQLEINSRTPLQKAIDEYHAIVDMGGGVVEDLEVINAEALRLGVKLASVIHQGSSIMVNCQADDSATFDKYLAALEASGRFSPIPPREGYPYITGGIVELKPISE